MSIDPVAPIASPLPITQKPDPVKIATPDLMIQQNPNVLPVDTMTDIIFQEIGGHEIINISRNDLVNGRNIPYQLVRNLDEVNIEYNTQNILPIPGGSDDYFNSFHLRFNEHIPTVLQDSDGRYYYLENPSYSPAADGTTVYIEPETGDLIIDLVNMKATHQVEVEIVNQVTIKNDTIYTGDNF